jgi:hypothetical protein
MEIYNIALAVIFAIIIYGIFLGAGQNRKMVVFMNYDDLGLTFAVPASALGIHLLFHWLGGDPRIGAVIGGLVVMILLYKLVCVTYHANTVPLATRCWR